jgi:hypothetical protein
MVGRSQENFRVRRPPGRQSGRPQGGRDHEGMCWGACAEKRTSAIGPVERTVRQRNHVTWGAKQTTTRVTSTARRVAATRALGKPGGTRLASALPRFLAHGQRKTGRRTCCARLFLSAVRLRCLRSFPPGLPNARSAPAELRRGVLRTETTVQTHSKNEAEGVVRRDRAKKHHQEPLDTTISFRDGSFA